MIAAEILSVDFMPRAGGREYYRVHYRDTPSSRAATIVACDAHGVFSVRGGLSDAMLAQVRRWILAQALTELTHLLSPGPRARRTLLSARLGHDAIEDDGVRAALHAFVHLPDGAWGETDKAWNRLCDALDEWQRVTLPRDQRCRLSDLRKLADAMVSTVIEIGMWDGHVHPSRKKGR